jgi:hypothetical protein
MGDLLKHYRRVHQQGFMPIFVEDGRDARIEVEACVAAGMKAIEFTLRRRDAKELIPWIRREHPDTLMTSTLPMRLGSRRCRTGTLSGRIFNHCQPFLFADLTHLRQL